CSACRRWAKTACGDTSSSGSRGCRTGSTRRSRDSRPVCANWAGRSADEDSRMNAPAGPVLRQVSLDDRYDATDGTVYLTGTQALVRLPLMQRRRDAAAGLNTAGYVSGYRGSPVGGYDQALWRAKRQLDAHHVRFVPGLNEDLAATAIWGTQQLGVFPGARYDGVFGIWTAKGAGVDRSGAALRDANQAGSARHGGVLASAGDDHGAKSSTMAAQTDFVFQAVGMPVLAPATVQDYLDLGLH